MSHEIDTDRDSEPDARARRFADNLLSERRKAGLSQEELSHRSGVAHPAIGVFEHARHEPSLRTVVKLAHGLGVSTEVLVRGL